MAQLHKADKTATGRHCITGAHYLVL